MRESKELLETPRLARPLMGKWLTQTDILHTNLLEGGNE
jgi:hypothetical protein